MEKINSFKIKLGIAKYILLEVAKYKNIPTHSKKIFIFEVAMATSPLY